MYIFFCLQLLLHPSLPIHFPSQSSQLLHLCHCWLFSSTWVPVVCSPLCNRFLLGDKHGQLTPQFLCYCFGQDQVWSKAPDSAWVLKSDWCPLKWLWLCWVKSSFAQPSSGFSFDAEGKGSGYTSRIQIKGNSRAQSYWQLKADFDSFFCHLADIQYDCTVQFLIQTFIFPTSLRQSVKNIAV